MRLSKHDVNTFIENTNTFSHKGENSFFSTVKKRKVCFVLSLEHGKFKTQLHIIHLPKYLLKMDSEQGTDALSDRNIHGFSPDYVFEQNSYINKV